MNKTSIYIFFSIFLLAIFKYFYLFPQRAMFDFDQEYLAMSAKSILVDHKLTLIGASTSVGEIFIGPLYNYFIAGVFWIGKMDPYLIDFANNCWAVLTILGIFIVGKNLFNLKTGVFASLLAILSFNFLQNQNLPPLLFPLPLISLALFYLLNQKKINWIWVAIMLGFSFQLHFTAIFFPPMIISLVILRKEKIKAKGMILPLLIVILFLLPLILFDLRHNFSISKNAFNFFKQSNEGSFNLASQLFHSFYISFDNLSDLIFPNLLAIPGISAVLIALFGVFILAKKKRKKIVLLALAWLLIPVICFSFYKGLTLKYYYAIQEPIFFLLIGFLLSILFKKLFSKILILLLLAVLVNSLLFGKHKWSSNGGLFYKIKAFDFIKEKVKQERFYLSFTVDPARMGGYQYLKYYYQYNLLDEPDKKYQTATVIQPHFWHDIKSDYIFGDIGVGFSKDE